MCDYSLHGVKNRLANEGEQLFIHKFHTGSKGLASVTDLRNLEKTPPGAGVWTRFKCWVKNQQRLINGDLKRALPAVCIPPGARLRVDGIPAPMQRQFGVGPREEVTFIQLTAEPFRYRDVIRFANGEGVLLQRLSDGLRMDVLSLELAEENPAPKPAARTSILEQVGVG